MWELGQGFWWRIKMSPSIDMGYAAVPLGRSAACLWLGYAAGNPPQLPAAHFPAACSSRQSSGSCRSAGQRTLLPRNEQAAEHFRPRVTVSQVISCVTIGDQRRLCGDTISLLFLLGKKMFTLGFGLPKIADLLDLSSIRPISAPALAFPLRIEAWMPTGVALADIMVLTSS